MQPPESSGSFQKDKRCKQHSFWFFQKTNLRSKQTRWHFLKQTGTRKIIWGFLLDKKSITILQMLMTCSDFFSKALSIIRITELLEEEEEHNAKTSMASFTRQHRMPDNTRTVSFLFCFCWCRWFSWCSFTLLEQLLNRITPWLKITVSPSK